MKKIIPTFVAMAMLAMVTFAQPTTPTSAIPPAPAPSVGGNGGNGKNATATKPTIAPTRPSLVEMLQGQIQSLLAQIANLQEKLDSKPTPPLGPIITLLQEPQAPPIHVGNATVVHALSFGIAGDTRGEKIGQYASGIVVETENSDGLDAAALFDESGHIIGEWREFMGNQNAQAVVGEYVWLHNDTVRTATPRHLSVRIRTKRELGKGPQGRNFDIRVIGVQGNPNMVFEGTPITGRTITLDSTIPSEPFVVQSVPDIGLANITPYVANQIAFIFQTTPGANVLNMTDIETDIYAEGGKPWDMLVRLRGDNGQAVEEQQPNAPGPSRLVGNGKLRFTSIIPPYVGNRAGAYYTTVRLGDTWKDGGTIAFSTIPSSWTVSTKNGLWTMPSPHAPIMGPVLTVNPVATVPIAVVQQPIGGTLGSGEQNLYVTVYEAPRDRMLVLRSFEYQIIWLPVGQIVNHVNAYAFSDSGLTTPLTGTLAGGAVGNTSYSLANNTSFQKSLILVTNNEGMSSAIVMPAGQRAYVAFRGTVSPPTPRGAYGIGVQPAFTEDFPNSLPWEIRMNSNSGN